MSYHTMNKLTVGQWFSQPVVPISFLFSFSLLGFYFFYCVRSGLAKTEKQISWLLTFASSVVCTVTSIPCFFRFWRSQWDINLLSTDSALHTALVCFFISYLVLDLSLGSIYYKKRITLVTGWIHHTGYIVILIWLMRLRSASLFTAVSLIELPTMILAIGSLRQRWRSDFLFAFSFFVLRLLFHSWMIVALKQHHRVQSLWVVAVGILGLHIYWFGCIIRQQIRLHSENTLRRISGITVAKRKQNNKRQHNLLDKVFAI